MSTHATHPFGADQSKADKLIERIGNASWRLGFLGFLTFLQHLRWISDAFEIMQIFSLFFIFLFVPPLLGIGQYLYDYVSSSDSDGDSSDPTGWMTTGYESHPLKALQLVAFMVHPNTAIRGAAQLFGNVFVLARHGGTLPEPSTYDSEVDYQLPFDGEWTVHSGSPSSTFSHSWFPVQQRYAYDFVKTDEQGRTHDGSGGPESFYCFDEPVRAPADGTVVTVKDGHRDYHRTTGWLDPLQYRFGGNLVVIKHAEKEYSFLAHLKKNSIRVSEGDTVRQGEEIGRCGHSGNSTEPHLHFQIQDRSNFYSAMSLPIRFTDIVTTAPDGSSQHHDEEYVHCGQLVTNESRSESVAETS